MRRGGRSSPIEWRRDGRRPADDMSVESQEEGESTVGLSAKPSASADVSARGQARGRVRALGSRARFQPACLGATCSRAAITPSFRDGGEPDGRGAQGRPDMTTRAAARQTAADFDRGEGTRARVRVSGPRAGHGLAAVSARASGSSLDRRALSGEAARRESVRDRSSPHL